MQRIKRGVPRKDNVVRLPLAPEGCGDWIEVKKILSSGERGDILDYSIKSVTQGKPGGGAADTKLEIDYGKQKFATAAAYVLNWNLIDHDEAPIPYIAGGAFEARLAQIRALDDATVDAINAAIEAHEQSVGGNASASASTGADAGVPTSPSHT